MAIQRNFRGTQIIKPGGYSVLDTSLLTQAPLGASGIIAVIGTADGGEPNKVFALSGGQIQAAKDTFKSGPIAEVLDLLVSPSNDPRVPSGASRILVYKTNQSTQAAKSLLNEANTPVDVLTLTSLNFGVDENNINVQISEGVIPDSNAKLTATPGAATYDMTLGTLIITVNGTARTYTPQAGDFSSPTAATPTEVMNSLNNNARWAANRPVVASLNGNVIILTLIQNVTYDANQLEYGVLVASGTLRTELDLPTGPVRGVKGSRLIVLNKGLVTETSTDLGTDVRLSVQYIGAGSAASLSIQDVAGVLHLTTSITGGPGGEALDIVLSSTLTIDQLVNQIAANPAYTCTSSFFNKEATLAKNELDFYLSLDIKNAVANLFGVVRELQDWVNANSGLASAEYLTNINGQLVASSVAFFTGAVRGGASNSNFQDGFDALRAQRINIIVPVCSEDGIGDDSFTIDSVNAQCEAHCGYMNSILGKSERLGSISKDGDKDAIFAASRGLNSANVQLWFQSPTVLDNTGTLRELPPFALAALVAGVHAGTPVGEPATHKTLRIVNLTQDNSIDIKRDAEELILNAVAFAEQTDSGGFRVAIDNLTYNKDSNSVFNRFHTYEAALFTSFELRTYLEGLFTGVRAATGIADAIKNAAIFRLSQLREEGVIVDGSEDDGTVIPAFRDIRVEIEGSTAKVSGVITPVPGIDFILNTIFLTELRASSSS